MPRIAYGTHRDQFAELTLPDAAAPHPVAVLLHGGFWRARYALDLMDGLAADLAARGWAAWNVEYRRLGEGGGYPETLEDVTAAVDALADLELPLDLDRVVTIGHSAGGQLALWLATRNPHPHRVRIAAAVGQAAVSDLERAAVLGLGDGVVAQFCGGLPDEVPQAYRAASPAVGLPTGLPTLLVHGSADDVVPVELSERYVAAARAGGDDARLVVHEGDGHMEHVDPSSDAWATVTGWLTRFT